MADEVNVDIDVNDAETEKDDSLEPQSQPPANDDTTDDDATDDDSA